MTLYPLRPSGLWQKGRQDSEIFLILATLGTKLYNVCIVCIVYIVCIIRIVCFCLYCLYRLYRLHRSYRMYRMSLLYRLHRLHRRYRLHRLYNLNRLYRLCLLYRLYRLRLLYRLYLLYRFNAVKNFSLKRTNQNNINPYKSSKMGAQKTCCVLLRNAFHEIVNEIILCISNSIHAITASHAFVMTTLTKYNKLINIIFK
jgi:hypothetical protein